jgi:hypothetical protein
MRIVLPVVFLLAFVACKRQPSPTVFIDPALVTLVSRDTVLLAGVRVEALRQTPIYKNSLVSGKFPALDKFEKESGLDLRKDLWEVLLASDGVNTITMLRGKFAEMGMEPRVNRAGATRFAYKGSTLLGDEENATVFVNPSTAVVGSAKALRKMIDERNQTSGLPPQLAAKVAGIPSSNQVWFVADFDKTKSLTDRFTEGPLQMIPQLARHMQTATGSFNLTNGLNANIIGTTKAESDAVRLKETLQALLSFARIRTQTTTPELAAIYDMVSLKAEARELQVQINMPEQLAEDLLGSVARDAKSKQ